MTVQDFLGTEQVPNVPDAKGKVTSEEGKHKSNMHTVFLGDCSQYFQWMSMGMFHSHKKSGQPGPITRVMCCTEEQEAAMPKEWLDLGPTHVARSMAWNPHNNDHYSAYNKPYAVIDFLTRATPKEDWLVLLDSDMQLRLPFICAGSGFHHMESDVLEIDCVRGHPISAFYGYLIGANNELSTRHIPNVAPRNDTTGGQPAGRRSDQVGGIFILHRDDIREYMNDWLTITEDVRFDPEAWHLSGDVYSTRAGMKPWISEMYGYSFAAAKHDMWHTIDRVSMMYPGYLPNTPPRLIHYGLDFSIESHDGTYKFDKHWHYQFNPFGCRVSIGTTTEGGLFPMPPSVKSLLSPSVGRERLRDLISMETVNTLNEAFCEHHRQKCVPAETRETAKMMHQCDEVTRAAAEIRDEYYRIGNVREGEDGALCRNDAGDEYCSHWASEGACNVNAGFMASQCVKACSLCYPTLPAAELHRMKETDSSSLKEDEAQERVVTAVISMARDVDASPGLNASPEDTMTAHDDVKDVGKLAPDQGGGTAPNVVRAPRRHAGTLSEDESNMSRVEFLRGSEDDVGDHSALESLIVGSPEKINAASANAEVRSATVHRHGTVPTDKTNGRLQGVDKATPRSTVIGWETADKDIMAYGIGGASVWLLLVVVVGFLQTVSRRRRERHRSSSLLPSISPREAAYTIPSMAHHL